MKKSIFFFMLCSYSSIFCILEKQRLQPSGTLCDLVKQNKLVAVQEFLEKSGSKLIDQVGSDGEAPLHWASILGLFDMVKLLLDKGANPNVLDNDGDTPLHSVSINGNTQIAQLLLDRGSTTTVNHIDRHGYVALHSAAFNNNFEVIKILLDHGALETINHRAHNGLTPLGAACKNSSKNAKL